MKLNELWNQPYPVKWESKNASFWQGVFTVGDFPYGIDIFKLLEKQRVNALINSFGQHKDIIEKEGAWEILFYIDRNRLSTPRKEHLRSKYGAGFDYVLLQTGNSVAALSTVIAALNEFVNQVHPKLLCFSAGEPSRIKLYNRIIKSLGYHAEQAESHGSVIYLVILD